MYIIVLGDKEMALKVNNSIIKESNTMEERNEAVGLKIKDIGTAEETPVVPEEESIPDEVEPEIEEPVEDVVPEEVIEPALEPEPEVVVNPESPIVEPTKKDGFNKIGCARLFNAAGTTVFRFDIFYKEYAENSGTIEYRNIVDNFDSVRPTKAEELKEFFAMFGIIRWNFPKTVLPVNTNVLIALLKIESLINEQIKSSGIKKGRYEFRVDTSEDYRG